MITFIYAVLVFQVLRFSVTLFNFLSNPKLGYYGKHFSDPLSIIISGRHEEAEELLQSISEQDYTNIEVFFKDEQDENVLLQKASGRYFLFIDAASTVKTGLFNNLIQRMRVFDLDLLSLIPNRQPVGFFEHCTLPLQELLLLNLFPLRFVGLNNALALSLVNKSCVFYNAQRYRLQHRGLQESDSLKMKTEILLANRFIDAKSHLGIADQSQLLLRTLGRSIPVTLVYLLLTLAGPVFMIFYFDFSFLLLPVGLIFLSRIMISFLTRQNPLINLILHPLQMLMLAVLLLRASWKKVFTPVQH